MKEAHSFIGILRLGRYATPRHYESLKIKSGNENP